MNTSAKRRVALVLVLGATVVGVTGFTLRDLPLVWLSVWRLDSPGERVRLDALARLGEIGSPMATPHLVSYIRRTTDEVTPSRRRAFEIIIAVESRPAVVLERLLTDDDWIVRFWAACFLGNLGEDAAPSLDALLAARADPKAQVREAASIACERVVAASRRAARRQGRFPLEKRTAPAQ